MIRKGGRASAAFASRGDDSWLGLYKAALRVGDEGLAVTEKGESPESGAADVPLSNQHMLNTVRIEVCRRDGSWSVGTGFMHRFCETGDEGVQCVITNRHVIAESASCELVFRSRRVGAADSEIVSSTIRFDEGFEERWYVHPDPGADLAVLPVSNEFRQIIGNGFTPVFKATQKVHLATREAAANLNAVEEILMVGVVSHTV